VSASERQTLALIRSYRSLAGQFGHGGVIKTTSSPRGALRVLRMRTHTRGLLGQRSYGAEVMAHHAGPNWPVASARRSVSRVLSRRERRGWPSISGRRLPDGSCGRPEGWAAHLSPADGCPPAGCALLFGLAPGGVCPFHSVRRLAPPAGIVTVALVLASRRAGVTRHPALGSSDFPHASGGLPHRRRATIRPPR